MNAPLNRDHGLGHIYPHAGLLAYWANVFTIVGGVVLIVALLKRMGR